MELGCLGFRPHLESGARRLRHLILLYDSSVRDNPTMHHVARGQDISQAARLWVPMGFHARCCQCLGLRFLVWQMEGAELTGGSEV